VNDIVAHGVAVTVGVEVEVGVGVGRSTLTVQVVDPLLGVLALSW
jgi:hypothetical protein